MTVDRIIDAEAVLGGLKDFQRATSEWVFRRMFEGDRTTDRFLVADEVGLGKTHVAKGVIAQVVDHLQSIGDRRHDIVYVCSNGAIARQNLRKLVPHGITPLDTVERLTMLPVADLEANAGVNLLAITPGTSLNFGSSTGRFEERVLAYTFVRAVWGADAFRTSRARRIFWEGVTKQPDERLRDLSRTYARQVDGVVGDFARELAVIDRARRHHQLPTVRATFDGLVHDLAYQRSFPDGLRSTRSALISDIRRAMATVGIAMLEPDLVILDEFQRFKDLLDPDEDSWAAQLANRLFTHVDRETRRPTKNLLLSATPYRMYTLADEATDDHYTDFVATCRFLFDDDRRVDALQNDFRLLRQSLTDPAGHHLAKGYCQKIERQLRQVMSRTERLSATADRSGMLAEHQTVAPVTPVDIEAYVRTGDVAEAVGHFEPAEYWKSSPYLFNFMEGYQLKRALVDALSRRMPGLAKRVSAGPGMLDWDEVDRYERIDPQNGRLRWLVDDLEAGGAFDLLWLPPSLPYYRAGSVYETDAARALTKKLIFSGWQVVPKVVSTIVSHEAERRAYSGRSLAYTDDYRARGGQRLDYRMTEGRPAAMTAFLFVWPSPTLAALGDPRAGAAGSDGSGSGPGSGGAGASQEADRVLQRVAAAIGAALEPHVSQAVDTAQVDQRWYWAAPLLLDRERHLPVIDDWFEPDGAESHWTNWAPAGQGFLAHIDEAWHLLCGEAAPLGRVPDDLAEVLALVAVGGPTVCALRAVADSTRLGLDDPAVLTAAARAGWGFRSFFNAPDVTAIVERADSETDRAYWRAVAAHGVAGNLQAVLDEHAHVLRDWLGFVQLDDDKRPQAAGAIGDKLAEALDVRTSTNRVDLPRPRRTTDPLDERRMRCRFAVPFGTQRLEGGGEARVESVSTAFNSPFWPFVLTSTSVGQEGLDFHLWCHAVVHWNLPSNPVDLEQREGRVHRYKGHAVRKNLAARFGEDALKDPSGVVWDRLFELGASPDSEMVPYWVFDEGPARIERHVPVLPFSRDAAFYPKLKKSLAAYRLALGQPRQEELVEYLSQHRTEEEVQHLVEDLRIDLSPPATT